MSRQQRDTAKVIQGTQQCGSRRLVTAYGTAGGPAAGAGSFS